MDALHEEVDDVQGDHYVEHGVFRRGETATSALLDGFAVSVAEVFDAA